MPARRERAFANRSRLGALERGDRGAIAEVQQRDRVRHAVHAVVTDRGQVVEQRGGDDAARAEAHDVDVGAAGDLARSVDGGEHPAGVGVEVPRALLGGRVAPAEQEHLDALAGRVLDEAAPGAQVEEVEAADRRRDEDQRALVHLLGGGLVLHDLAHLVALHHGAGREREVLAHLERVALDHRGHAAVVAQVADEVADAAHEAHATGVERALDRGRVGGEVVGGRQRAVEDRGGEAGLLSAAAVLCALAQLVDEVAHGLRGGKVAALDPREDGVARPGRVGEAPVVLGGADLRTAEGDAHELTAELGRLPGDRAAVPECGGQAADRLAERRNTDHLAALWQLDAPVLGLGLCAHHATPPERPTACQHT